MHFSIFDQERIQAIEGDVGVPIEDEDDSFSFLTEIGEGESNPANPFESEQLILCSLDVLTRNPVYQDHVKSAEFDLLIVDEAHHLAWTTHSTSPEFDCIAALAKRCPGMLLLTATPESIGIESYFAQLSLLDPSRFHDLDAFKQEQSSYSVLNDLVQELLELKNCIGQPKNNQEISTELLEKLKGYLPAIKNDNRLIKSETISTWIDQLIDRHGTSRVLFSQYTCRHWWFPCAKIEFISA